MPGFRSKSANKMKRQSHHRSDNNQPIAFARKHRFKDTLALFIVFLSFNHFASLCLLISFVIATRCRNFLANSFITLFLSKKPSPPMTEVSHVDHESSTEYLMNPTDRKSTASYTRKNRLNLSIPLLLGEMIFATILKFYGEDYFMNPIENLALSILASSMINDPSDCLSYATSCSVLYAATLHIYRKSGVIRHLHEVLSQLGSIYSLSIPLLKSATPLDGEKLAQNLLSTGKLLPWIDRYGRHLLYYISFHIVVYQFGQSTLNPHHYDDKVKISKKAYLPKNEANRGAGQRISSGSTSKPSFEATISQNPPASLADRGINGTQDATTNSSPGLYSAANLTANYHKKNVERQTPTPYFTEVVSQFESFEPSLTFTSENNFQAGTTNVTLPSPTTSRGTESDEAAKTYTNQFYEIKVDFKKNRETRNLNLDVTVTSNLENFIRHLFKRKNQHLIPPLWSIVVTLKTTNFEKKYLNGTREVSLTPTNSGTGSDNEVADNCITPTNSNNSFNDEVTESVFNKSQSSGTMAVIAQTASDDYAQLHLVSTKDNIFNKNDNDFKVCIVEIASNSITFQIENLHEGELIVLVNGVIWSEVSCALILEHEGEELVVVGGLVPACSYDIQFINRLNQLEDYLIADLMVRTVGGQEASERFENIDFSFPSYYHRKFLSPLLTLKHSVLTTNTNLAEGRVKLKKSKKEISKKLNALRQEIDHYKSKISQNASNDEKSASKVESLKTAVQQSEKTLAKLEQHLKQTSDKEALLEEEYLKQKDAHLRKQMEYSKLEDLLKTELNTAKSKSQKLQQDLNQLNAKKEKLSAKQERLQKEVDQTTEAFELFKSQFVAKREKDRAKRFENRAREANEFEMNIKGLEQDISRLEGENGNIQKITQRI